MYYYTIFQGYNSAPETNVYLFRSPELLDDDEVRSRFLASPDGDWLVDDFDDGYECDEEDFYLEIERVHESRVKLL